MAITRNDNLDIRAPKPVDKRMEVLLYEDLKDIKYVYYGQLTYVIKDNQTFRCLTKDGSKPSNLEDGRTLIPVENQNWVLEGDVDPGCCLDDIYTSNIPPARLLPEKVGGFKPGTPLSNYLGLTFSELFDILLFPEDVKGTVSTVPSVGTTEITGGTYEVRYTIFSSDSNPDNFIWKLQKTDKNGVISMIDNGDQNSLPNNSISTQVYDAVKGEISHETYDLVIQEPSQHEKTLSRATFNINVKLSSITGNINADPSNILVESTGTYNVNYTLNLTPSTPTHFYWKIEKTYNNTVTIIAGGDEVDYEAGTLVQDYVAQTGDKEATVYRLKVDENQLNVWKNVSTAIFTIDVPDLMPDGKAGVINAQIFMLDEANPNKIDTEEEFLNRDIPKYLDTPITESMLNGAVDINLEADPSLVPQGPPLHGVYEIPKAIAPNGVSLISSIGSDISNSYMKVDGITRNTWIYIYDGATGGEGTYPKIAPVKLLKK